MRATADASVNVAERRLQDSIRTRMQVLKLALLEIVGTKASGHEGNGA
jgi:hypothetical protein